MKTYLKKALALMLAMSMCLSMAVVGASAETEVPPAMPEGGMPGDMGGMMPPDGMGPPPEGGMSGGNNSGMPSEETTDSYMSDSMIAAVAAYGFYSEDFAKSAITFKDVDSAYVGGEDNVYSLEEIASQSDTAAEYVQKYGKEGGYNSFIVLGASENVDGTTAPGNGISIDAGTLNVDNVYIQTSGAVSAQVSGRYGIATLSNATSIINDSTVIHTGATEATESISAPPSNGGLLISGRGRSNFSIGATTTMYFNSTVVAEGWASMSTDSATGTGLYFYSYNSKAVAENGGYGVYSDTNCKDYLYATEIEAAEVGVIISNNGYVYVGSGADAEDVNVKIAGADADDLLSYNNGATSDAPSVLKAGRNTYQLHSPDMMGQGTKGYQAQVDVENSILVTTTELVSTEDYEATYDASVKAYVDYISGANILVKSTGAVIDLNNVTAESYSNTLLLTALNSDSMSRYLKSEGHDVEMTITNSTIEGDIQHDDYQRDVYVTITDSVYSGAINYSTAEEWNAAWAEYADYSYCYWANLDPATYITETHETAITLDDAEWKVTGDSRVTSLDLIGNATVVIPEGVTLTVGEETYTNTTLGAEKEEVSALVVVSGSNGALLQGDESAALTLMNEGNTPAEITVVTLGEEEVVSIGAGETYVVDVPADDLSSISGSGDGYADDTKVYKLALTAVDPNGDYPEYAAEYPVAAGTSLAGKTDITVSIVEAVVDYYASHGSYTARWITAALYADENGVDPVKSVLAMTNADLKGGEKAVDGVNIISYVDNTSAIRTGGTGELSVKNASIILYGDGGDDFTGIGAALAAADDSTLNVDGATVFTSGILRSAIFGGDNGTMNLYNLTSNCDPGEYQTNVSIPSAGMASPPSGLGIWGNCRAMNLVTNATINIYNSTITSRDWGVLGVDDVTDGHLYVKDSTINITDQGYGSYAIGQCEDIFDNCVFNIEYGVVNYAAAGDGAVVKLINGTKANSLNYYGIVTHQSFNGTNTVIVVDGEGTELNTGLGGIIAKGRGSDITISNGAVVTAESGVLVRAQINDDTGAGSMDGTEVVNVTVSNTTLTGDIVQGMGAAQDEEAPVAVEADVAPDAAAPEGGMPGGGMEGGPMGPMGPMGPGGAMGPGGPGMGGNAVTESTMNVTLDDASLTGAISSAFLTLAIEDGNISMDNITSVGVVTETVYGNNADAVLNVTVKNGSTWIVDETSYLMSLTIDETSAVKAPAGAKLTMTVNSKPTDIKPGEYTGEIVLTVEPVADISFTDVTENDWFYAEVMQAAEKGIVNGMGNGTFAPNDNVTRAQAAKMIAVALGLEIGSGATAFADVPADQWYAPYVAAAVKAGAMKGQSAAIFNPDASLTRAEAAALMVQALGLTAEGTADFNDVTADDWFADEVAAAVKAGIVKGTGDGNYAPNKSVTRAELAAMIVRALAQEEEAPVAPPVPDPAPSPEPDQPAPEPPVGEEGNEPPAPPAEPEVPVEPEEPTEPEVPAPDAGEGEMPEIPEGEGGGNGNGDPAQMATIVDNGDGTYSVTLSGIAMDTYEVNGVAAAGGETVTVSAPNGTIYVKCTAQGGPNMGLEHTYAV